MTNQIAKKLTEGSTTTPSMSEVLLIILNVFRKLASYSALVVVAVSVFLIAYIDTASLQLSLGISIRTISLTYVAGILSEIIVRLIREDLPEEIESIKYLASFLQVIMLFILGDYLIATSPYRLSPNAYRIVTMISITGIVAYVIDRIYYTWRKAKFVW